MICSIITRRSSAVPCVIAAGSAYSWRQSRRTYGHYVAELFDQLIIAGSPSRWYRLLLLHVTIGGTLHAAVPHLARQCYWLRHPSHGIAC